jgi:hypothetical protein
LFPRDAQLNLPRQRYSHRLQKRVAAKAAKMSFESVASDIVAETGVRIGTRQIEGLLPMSQRESHFSIVYSPPYMEETPQLGGDHANPHLVAGRPSTRPTGQSV